MTYIYRPNIRNVSVTVAPSVEPVSLEEAKLWIDIPSSFTDQDSRITSLIKSAREMAEHYMRIALITQTQEYTLDEIPRKRGGTWLDNAFGTIQIATSELYGSQYDYIDLPRGPVQSVSSFQYYDTSDTINTFSSDNYYVDTANNRIVLNYSQIWPVDLRDQNAILITYISGFGDAATDVPESIKNGMLMHIQRMYETRYACDVPKECKSLYDIYRRGDRRAVRG